MADIAEEERLGPIEIGQRLGAFAHVLLGAGVGDRYLQLAGDQFEEFSGFPGRSHRIDAREQQPRQPLPAQTGYR